jgi:hypothetical protein
MADQLSSTASKKSKKKGGGKVKHILDLFKRPSNSASQSNSTVTSAFGAHDPVSGNDAGNAEPMASGKYIHSILVLSTTTWPLSR